MASTDESNRPGTPSPLEPGEVKIAAVQEDLEVSLREAETGAVRVRKIVHEDVHQVPVTARTGKVSIVRVPVGRPVEQEFPVRQEGETTVIPVFEYRVVAERRLFLVEEVRVTKEVVQTTRTEEVVTRREEVVIERREGESGPWRQQPPDAPE
jgi:stress response protein YsnF